MSQYEPTIEQRRFRPLAIFSMDKHLKEKAADPDGVNHSGIKLRGTVVGRKDFGRVILVGCACGTVWWRNKDVVTEEMLAGDWAAPFRRALNIRTTAPTKAMKGKNPRLSS